MAADILEPALDTAVHAGVVRESLSPRYRLAWLDASLHEATVATSLEPYLRVRDFKHLGGAIAWARRRIFHGEAFGDVIEMSKVVRRRFDGVYEEDVYETRDITLAGFRAWERQKSWGSSHSAWVMSNPTKRCYWE